MVAGAREAELQAMLAADAPQPLQWNAPATDGLGNPTNAWGAWAEPFVEIDHQGSAGWPAGGRGDPEWVQAAGLPAGTAWAESVAADGTTERWVRRPDDADWIQVY